MSYLARCRIGLCAAPCLLGALLVFATTPPARAFDPFNWFSINEAAPAPSRETLPYRLSIEGSEDSDLRLAVNEAALLNRLRNEAPADGEELLRRAEADLPRIIDALWGHGHYAGTASLDIAGERLSLDGGNRAAIIARTEASRGKDHVAIKIRLVPGPLYHFAPLRLIGRDGRTVGTDRVPAHLHAALVGAPARSEALSNAARRILDHVRAQGHPHARIDDPEPVVDHPAKLVRITLALAEGPRAMIGAVTVSGAEGIDHAVIRSHLYLAGGTLYAPQRIAEIRRSVGRIEAVGSVRVKEGEKLAPDGTLPLDVEVRERPLRLIGGSVGYSTVDGPALRAYWAHRNLFGGAERLRLDGDLSYLTSARQRLGGTGNRFDVKNIAGRLGAGFIKPAIAGSPVDFVLDGTIARTGTLAYTSRLANLMAGFRYRFADKAWVQAGLEGEVGQTSDIFGRMTYRLIGVPLSGSWDTTDNELDPGRGFRLSGSITPYIGFGEVAQRFVISKLQASAYYPLDTEGRYVVAGRIGLGAIFGGSIREIPANRRFFAGGGGSVRGYEYRSLGPRDAAGRLMGGRSLFEASLELRIRVSETIGIVPFIDTGTAFTSSLPAFDERLRFGAGIGLRYHTAIGPIRLDIATPLDRRKGERPVALYISLGQAF